MTSLPTPRPIQAAKHLLRLALVVAALLAASGYAPSDAAAGRLYPGEEIPLLIAR